MQRTLVCLKSDVVVDRIVGDDAFKTWILSQGEFDDVVEDGPGADIGATWLDGTFTRPTPYANAGTLENAQQIAFAVIDARTDAIFLTGFEFAGNRYSLTNEAQSRFIAMLVAKDILSYPIQYNSLDDTYRLDIEDAAMLVQFIMTAMATARAYLDSGTQLKSAVRVATTIAEVAAIVDPR